MNAQMKINGDWVRALREEKSWSQEHLAAAAGLSARTVQRVEAESMGSSETRLALASALGVPVSQLMPAGPSIVQNDQKWDRIPLGAWLGLGIGALSGSGAAVYSYLSGAAAVDETSRSLGIVCALIGTSLGVMGAIRGWVRSRTTAA